MSRAAIKDIATELYCDPFNHDYEPFKSPCPILFWENVQGAEWWLESSGRRGERYLIEEFPDPVVTKAVKVVQSIKVVEEEK